MLHGKVFLTGGAGFLGRAIMRRAEDEAWPCSFTVYSRDETHQEVARRRFPRAHYVLGDVCDYQRVWSAMLGHDTVIHAAAFKYIPEAELNAYECIRVNAEGSKTVAQAAKQAGIHRIVGISTDKAVRPVNTYGASKMLMERLFAEASTPATRFTCVRYGNVVGSTGSVIPLFKRQLATQGRLTVTDEQMTRFWMSADEAVDLIVLALSDEVAPGATVIPYVRAMKVIDLARLIAGEAPVDIIGIRPGEKLHEELLHHSEGLRVRERDGFIELLPVGQETGHEPMTIASHTPHYWLLPEEMAQMIEDAGAI